MLNKKEVGFTFCSLETAGLVLFCVMCGMVGLLSSRFHGRLSERVPSLAATIPLWSALGVNGSTR